MYALVFGRASLNSVARLYPVRSSVAACARPLYHPATSAGGPALGLFNARHDCTSARTLCESPRVGSALWDQGVVQDSVPAPLLALTSKALSDAAPQPSCPADSRRYPSVGLAVPAASSLSLHIRWKSRASTPPFRANLLVQTRAGERQARDLGQQNAVAYEAQVISRNTTAMIKVRRLQTEGTGPPRAVAGGVGGMYGGGPVPSFETPISLSTLGLGVRPRTERMPQDRLRS